MLSFWKMYKIIKESDFEKQKKMIDALPEKEKQKLIKQAEKISKYSSKKNENP